MWKKGDEGRVGEPLAGEPVACSLVWGGRCACSDGKWFGRSGKVSGENEEPHRVGRRDWKPNPERPSDPEFYKTGKWWGEPRRGAGGDEAFCSGVEVRVNVVWEQGHGLPVRKSGKQFPT